MVELPDLSRFERKKGIVNRDFNLSRVFSHIDDDNKFKIRGRFGREYPGSLGEKLFLGYYDVKDAIFRSDFLAEWVDNGTRKELNRIIRNLPALRLNPVREAYERNMDSEWGDDLDQEDDEDKGVKIDKKAASEIRSLKKYLRLPETFEMAAEYSGTSEAAKLFVRFCRKAREELETFQEHVKPFKECPQFRDNSTDDIQWANETYREMVNFYDVIDNLRQIRRKLKYYEFLAIPFELEIDGRRIPVCKPVYFESDRREGHIINAYNPLHFRIGIQRGKPFVIALNVPNDIHWDNKRRQIYVYGPNNQGKSVFLNTAALNIHLAMNGSLCFADSCELSLPGRLYTCLDLGDSANSGHFVTGGMKLKQMLDEVHLDDIVFLDEHAGGAEPDQERKIAKGITYGLTKYRFTFFHATNDRESWRHSIGRGSKQILRVADYGDEERRFKVWHGIAKSGYSMQKAREMGIDPDSVLETLDRRLGR